MQSPAAQISSGRSPASPPATTRPALPISRYSRQFGRPSTSRIASGGVEKELIQREDRIRLSQNLWKYICLGGLTLVHTSDPCSVAQAEESPPMALSETSFDPSAADLINLRKILEACIHVPDIGDTSGQPNLTREQRFCLALDRFESTTKVFDVGTYESEVLHVGTTEEELDARLRREAREVGVVERHFPIVKRRRLHNRGSKHISNQYQQSAATTDLGADRKASIAVTDPARRGSGNNVGYVPAAPSTRVPTVSRPSLSTFPVDRTTGRAQEPTPAQSVMSFKTTSSQSSNVSRFFGKRRDSRHSIKQFFWRPSSSRTSSVSESIPPLQYNHNQQHTIHEEPDAVSPHSHESQDLSSIQSLSISSRTSVSSFGEQQPDQDISGVNQHCIERFVNSRPFLQLRAVSDVEIVRFNSFAMDQHIALPLILGRNHLYNQDRMKIRLADLKREHQAETEGMEDRFASKELQFREMHQAAMEDTTTRNATAVKYVASRIALLGDDATPEHHHRLQEEQSALKRLGQKQATEMRNLVRYQESKKLELQRKQEKDYEAMRQSLQSDLASQLKDKTAKHRHNIIRLDELIDDRKGRLVARIFLKLQILKCTSNDTIAIQSALPLSLLGLPAAFTGSLGYK